MKLKVGLFNFYKPLVKKKTSVGKSILRKIEGLLTLQVYLNTSKKIRKKANYWNIFHIWYGHSFLWGMFSFREDKFTAITTHQESTPM